MSDFFVDPAAIRAFADTLVQTNVATARARDYAGQWVAGVDADAGGACFTTSAAGVRELGTVVTQFLDRVHLVVAGSEENLLQSAIMYDHTEAHAAAQADRLLPGSQASYDSGGGL